MVHSPTTRSKVGAIRSKGNTSQLQFVGTLHSDYHDEVNKRPPEERPQSLIFALDAFNFIYESPFAGNAQMNTLHVPCGHAVVFSSALNHAGGSNPTESPIDNDYVYCIFAYIVSNEVDYPPEVEHDKSI
jgi:hypothetical protein